MTDAELSLRDLRGCFDGVIPAVIATAAADGTPNITYLSKVHYIDEQHVALSNQFFSKTSRNLAENPHASVLLIAPSHEQYRLELRYERTERRGATFERLRSDVETIAALEHLQDVFKLRAADVYRVVAIEQYPDVRVDPEPDAPRELDAASLGELNARLARCPSLDVLLETALDSLASLFGYEHSLLLLRDEEGSRLYTIASHGFPTVGAGSEITVGEGVVGMAAARCTPMRVGNLVQMQKYSRALRHAADGVTAPVTDIPLPGLPRVDSQLAAPGIVHGELVCVLAVESPEHTAFDTGDEALLGVVAGQIASAIQLDLARERIADQQPAVAQHVATAPQGTGPTMQVRFFPADGSVFLASEYLIKGVAGRILWALLGHYARDGRDEFTNREVRLDPSLELPELRANLESRLILLKRRLEERAAPIRIDKTGRGRFRLLVDRPVRLETVG